MPPILLAGDVDAIKDFVFETSSLPQISGGSDLLLECEECIRSDLQKQFGYKVVYCGGGGFLLEVDAEKAEEVKRAIERRYLKTTGIATVTIVCETEALPDLPQSWPQDGWAARIARASEESVQAGDFARRMAALASRMHEAKTRKTGSPFYEAFPFGRRCDRCGKRMGAYPDPVEGEKVLCPICKRKRRDDIGRKKAGMDIRGQFNQEFWGYYGKRFPAKQPEDLDTLVREARRGYLAFLYADGNDIGRCLQQARSEAEYRALSQALTDGTKQALFDALAQVCGKALRERKYWPFHILNIGGDDVTLLIQAGYAWEVAVRFLELFEEKVNTRLKDALGSWPSGWPERITASCGIAIADVKYPMRYFERLANDLLREAKKLAKKNPGQPTSAVTFLWLPTPVASEKAEPLMAFYRPSGDLRLTARPYTLEQARAILEASRKVARWPRTLRHRWAEALAQGVFPSVNLIHYDIARRQEQKRVDMYQTLVEIGCLVRPEEGDIPAPIWYQVRENNQTVWKTALLDALELAELEATRPEVEEEEAE